MKQEFTHEYMQANCGCYSREHLMAQTFMKSDPVLLRDILESDIPLKHKFWFVCHKLATKRQNQEIAIGCAELYWIYMKPNIQKINLHVKLFRRLNISLMVR